MLSSAKWYLFPAVVMLLISQFDWDYGYYQFLRVVVSFTSFYLTYLYWEEDSHWKFVYGGIGLLFNPFMPVHLERDIWAILDYLTAAIFIFEFFKKK